MMNRTKQEIEMQLDEAIAQVAEDSTLYPAMTYEQGVEAALRWILGETEDPPMEE